jgi:uncharacterized protein (DUF1810 family)
VDRRWRPKFGNATREKAEAVLGSCGSRDRLRECTRLGNLVEGRSIGQILGSPDDLKFGSSVTLFAGVPADKQVFKDSLEKYFGGELDPLTLERLG